MAKAHNTLAPTIVHLVYDRSNWTPTQCWFLERTRTVATRLYAQALAKDREGDDTSPSAVHKTAITSQVSKAFGALADESSPQFSFSWLVDLLVLLQDLGDIGFGYHIPRESRIARLAQRWGRVVGGLPLEASEHPEGGILSSLDETAGRLITLGEDFVKHDVLTEHPEIYTWQTSTLEQTLATLWSRLPERPVSRPPEENTEFYNARLVRARSRGERWRNKLPTQEIVVARSKSLPAHYYLATATTSGYAGRAWYELDKEEARKWVLLAEKMTGAVNLLRTTKNQDIETFFLPDMLPAAWTTALLACASAAVPGEEGGWKLAVRTEALPPLVILAKQANIQFL
jgi:hypothetical protein